MLQIPDDELARLAAVHGPDSLEASVLAELRQRRGQDEQVHAFRIGTFYMVGPWPDTRTEVIMLAASAYAKRLWDPIE